eukprot:COSAG06_NODE_3956_length_4722_cov_20.775687_1_plen_159_part_00
MVHALRGKPGLQERVSVLRLWGLVPWRSRRMLPTSRSAARACSANPGEAGLGAQARQGAEAVSRQQKDEGSSAQEPANVREAEERVSPLRVWSFGSGSFKEMGTATHKVGVARWVGGARRACGLRQTRALEAVTSSPLKLRRILCRLDSEADSNMVRL